MSAAPLRATAPLTLIIRSPFLFRGLSGRLLGVDAAALRDPVSQRPIIPADQIRGVLREAVGDLVEAGVTLHGRAVTETVLDYLFGTASAGETEDGAANEPARGRLLFTDLTADTPAVPARTALFDCELTRVALNDETGAADEGMLQVIELCVPFGADLAFTGSITAFVADEAEAAFATELLSRALALIGSIGAAKSAGFGEVVETPQPLGTPVIAPLRPLHAEPVTEARRVYDVTFDRPYLVDSEAVADNVVAGSSIIPGAVFKGALARMLELAGERTDEGLLAGVLETLVIGSAFPITASGETIGRALPYSLIAQKVDGTVHVADVLDLDPSRDVLFGGKAALFPGDWKPGWYDVAAALIGRTTAYGPASEARTHTKIKSETGIADEGQLFTTLSRVHARPDGRAWTFRLTVDAGAIQDPQASLLARRLLAFLEQEGLDGIGKTGARATFAPVPRAALPTPSPMHGTRNRYAVTIETEALMVDALAMIDEQGRWKDGGDSRSAYAAYWDKVLPGAILHGYFAAEAYRGGHIARRRRSFGRHSYHPLLITQPGSVFLLETDQPDALSTLLRFGLPAAAQTGAAPLNWRNCRYLPENGFGQIAADYRSTPIRFHPVDP